jgi:long-chain acyl-CoA synthetase
MDRLDDAQVYLPDLWATYAKYQPNKLAIVCGDERATWADFDRGMNRVANRLLAQDLGRGTSVAVIMSNSVDMMYAMFGAVKAGARLVPISGLLTAEQILMMLNDSGAAAVIVSADLRHLVEPVRASTNIAPDRFIGHGFTGDGWISWQDWLGGASADQPDVTYTMDQPFNVIYSSGTTGAPKGIVQTHRARQHWAWSNAVEMRFSSTSRALTTTALYSNGTWLMVLPVLFAGGTLHVLPEFAPSAFLETVQRERITHTFMVPTQYILTLAHERLDSFDLSSLEVMLSAGSPLRLDTKREILNRMGPGLHELYGFSEGFAAMLKPDKMLEKFDSVGTPVLGFDLAILDDDGKELPRGEVGEIAGYGAGLMAEYNNRPELVDEAIWRDARGRTFFRSGDVGRLDEDGFLYIVDRKKDMIISGGFNIFPADLEEVIGGHPDVMDVTVIGIPDEIWGETPMALVIPSGGHPNAEAICEWANERLAKPQRISQVAFLDEFPRNALGKVLKRELRETIARQD